MISSQNLFLAFETVAVEATILAQAPLASAAFVSLFAIIRASVFDDAATPAVVTTCHALQCDLISLA